MKIYLDTCCWGRHKDDQLDARTKRETMAIRSIIKTCCAMEYGIVGSLVVAREIRRNQRVAVREAVARLYRWAVTENAPITKVAIERAKGFRVEGLGINDSLHLAVAEAAGVDVLLTVDDRFERISTNKGLSAVKVINPLKALWEALL